MVNVVPSPRWAASPAHEAAHDQVQGGTKAGQGGGQDIRDAGLGLNRRGMASCYASRCPNQQEKRRQNLQAGSPNSTKPTVSPCAHVAADGNDLLKRLEKDQDRQTSSTPV